MIKCRKCGMEGPPYRWMGGAHQCMKKNEHMFKSADCYCVEFSFILTREWIDWLTKPGSHHPPTYRISSA